MERNEEACLWQALGITSVRDEFPYISAAKKEPTPPNNNKDTCLWHALGLGLGLGRLEIPPAHDQFFNSSFPEEPLSPEDVKENIFIDTEYTEIRKSTRLKRRDSLQLGTASEIVNKRRKTTADANSNTSTNGGKRLSKSKKKSRARAKRKSLSSEVQNNGNTDQFFVTTSDFSSASSSLFEPSSELVDPQLLEIYRNQLWRSQMPIPQKLEVISEEGADQRRPRKDFRFLCFSEETSFSKIRLRRTKATKNGWKFLTKKKLAELDIKLEECLKKYEL